MRKLDPNKKLGFELALLLFISVIFFIIAANIDMFEWLMDVTREYEEYELDEIITLTIFLTLGLGLFSLRRWLELRKTNENLKRALGQIKQLKGIIPICASCKKVRDDDGYWEQVESYITKHSEDVKFSHSVCPDCAVKLYEEYRKE